MAGVLPKGPDVERVGVELPEWAILMGDGYGDGLAVLGNVQHLLCGTGQPDIGLIHYGWSKGLEEFMADQHGIREVMQVLPPSREVFLQTSNLAGAFYTDVPGRWLPRMLEGTGIDWRGVAMTQVHWPWGAWPVRRPVYESVVIRQDALDWAAAQSRNIGPFILVQPYSTNSVALKDHWSHWSEALGWLKDRVELPMVLCGLDAVDGFEGSGIVNMVGKTPTMMHVLALCELAEGIVTTCNAIPNWTALCGTPSLVAANLAISDERFFFYRFMNTPNNTMVPYQSSFARWARQAVRFLARWQ